MKTIITLFSIILTAITFQAQLKLIDPSHPGSDLNNVTIDVSGTPSDTEMEIAISVINTSNNTYSLACRRTEVDVQQGTKNSTCWVTCPPYVNQGAYPVLVIGGQVNTVLTVASSPGDTATGFLAHHDPQNQDGCSLYLYEWFDESAPSVTLASFYGRFMHNVNTSCAASLNDYRNIDFKIYPNPANNEVVLDIENLAQYNVSIIDLLGKTIITKNNLMSSKLDVSNLNNGVYFVSISKQGKLIKTEKLIIKH